MIETHQHDNIVEIRLARPPVNALDPAMIEALRESLSQQLANGNRAVVLSGAPGLFSAGLDIPALMRLDRDQLRQFWVSLFGLLEDLAEYPVPVAAAITGHSPAGGTVLALFCDYRVMARGEFQVGLNEVQVGLVVPSVIHQALARLIGRYPAERHLVAGQLIHPEAACHVGLVDELAEPDDTVQRAIDWCRNHLQLPALAMNETRRMVRSDLGALFADPDNLDVDAFCDHWFRDETQQALQQMVARLSK